MFKIGLRLLISRLLLTIFLIIGVGIAMREPTNQPPPEPPATTTTTTTTTIPEQTYTLLGTFATTAYSSWESCHNPQNNLCLMADGRPAEIGAIACPRKFSLQTKFIINGQEYICRDRLSLRYDNRFDLFFGYGWENYIRAKEWGVKYMEVYIKP